MEHVLALRIGVPVRIVDVTEFFSQRGGGVRSHLTSKGSFFQSAGHQQIIIAPGPKAIWQSGAPGDRFNSTGGEQIPVFDGRPILRLLPGPRLPYDASYSVLWNVARLRREVTALAPDVVEVHSPYVAAAALGNTLHPSIARTFVWHSDFVDTNAGVLRNLAPSWQRAIGHAEHVGWAWARKVAALSDATLVAAKWQERKLMAQGLDRVRQLPFGVDTSLFAPSRRSESVRRTWLQDATPNAKIVVAIGRMAVEKRWDDIIDSFLLAKASDANAILLLLGDGPERARLETRCRHHPEIRFLGFEQDRIRLATLLASADVLLHACPYETFGLGVAEALASGLYAVLPSEGGAAEFCDADRARAFVAGDNAQAAALLCSQLLRDHDGNRGFSRSEQHHFDDLAALYAELRAQRKAV